MTGAPRLGSGQAAGALAAGIALALLAAGLLAAGLIDRSVAQAQREFAARRYARADAALDDVERYLAYGRWIPWIRNGPLNEVRTQRAAMRYWGGEYDRVIADRSDPLGDEASESIELQLLAANAVYRRGQPAAKTPRAAVEALQAAASAYLAVLKNAPRSEVAAYNYEYVVRTREDIDKGRRAPELTDKAEDGPAGRRGTSPPVPPDQRDLKLLVPLEPGEMDKGVEPGKGVAIERKG
jgi:hypothetical protein